MEGPSPVFNGLRILWGHKMPEVSVFHVCFVGPRYHFYQDSCHVKHGKLTPFNTSQKVVNHQNGLRTLPVQTRARSPDQGGCPRRLGRQCVPNTSGRRPRLRVVLGAGFDIPNMPTLDSQTPNLERFLYWFIFIYLKGPGDLINQDSMSRFGTWTRVTIMEST